MQKNKIYEDNVLFFITAIGLGLTKNRFSKTVLESLQCKTSEFTTNNIGKPGCIKIDTSEIIEKGENFWHNFTKKVKKGFFKRESFLFGSHVKLTGYLAEKFEVAKDDYKFSFHIKQYRRDSSHNFEIINPENIIEIPNDEKLERIVHLRITLR